MSQISGITKIGGVLTRTTVSLYDSNTMALTATQSTTAGGSFLFESLLEGTEYYVIFRQLIGDVWTASTVYAESAIVRPTSPNGLWYLVTQGGTSGGTEPVWPDKIGNTFADGSCIVKAGGYTMLPKARGPLFALPE